MLSNGSAQHFKDVTDTQGWPEPCFHIVYDRMFSPAKNIAQNTAKIPYIHRI